MGINHLLHVSPPRWFQVGKVTVEVAQNVAKNETVQASVKGIQSTIDAVVGGKKEGAGGSKGNMADDIETGTTPTKGKRET